VEGHLDACAACRSALAELSAPGGALLGGLAEEPPPHRLWERLWAQVQAIPPGAGAADPLLAGLPLPAGARRELPPLREIAWHRLTVRGARLAVLLRDRFTGSALVLGHMPARRAFPRHLHLGPEDVLVLAGGYEDQYGTFEAGASTWAKTGGASVVSGNEPWKVLGSTHASSLKIPAGASAASQSMCIASAEDSLRFFYKSPGVSGSLLHVSIYVTSGVNVATNDYDVSGSTAGWAVSQRIMLPDIRDASGQQTVTITFSQRQTAATWQLDDVEIDPWKTL
jgi:anti-sigma factor ChrR (cupin superfamily)